MGLLRAPRGPRWVLKEAEKAPKTPPRAPETSPKHRNHDPSALSTLQSLTSHDLSALPSDYERREALDGAARNDPSALSTFQSRKVLRIRVLEGWRPPSSIHSLFLSLPRVPWDPCILILPVSQPSIPAREFEHFLQKACFRLDGSSIFDFLEKRPLPRLTKVSLFLH